MTLNTIERTLEPNVPPTAMSREEWVSRFRLALTGALVPYTDSTIAISRGKVPGYSAGEQTPIAHLWAGELGASALQLMQAIVKVDDAGVPLYLSSDSRRQQDGAWGTVAFVRGHQNLGIPGFQDLPPPAMEVIAEQALRPQPGDRWPDIGFNPQRPLLVARRIRQNSAPEHVEVRVVSAERLCSGDVVLEDPEYPVLPPQNTPEKPLLVVSVKPDEPLDESLPGALLPWQRAADKSAAAQQPKKQGLGQRPASAFPWENLMLAAIQEEVGGFVAWLAGTQEARRAVPLLGEKPEKTFDRFVRTCFDGKLFAKLAKQEGRRTWWMRKRSRGLTDEECEARDIACRRASRIYVLLDRFERGLSEKGRKRRRILRDIIAGNVDRGLSPLLWKDGGNTYVQGAREAVYAEGTIGVAVQAVPETSGHKPRHRRAAA